MPAQKVDIEHATHLAANLSMQRQSGKHCDVCICVADKRFLAHKNVLAAGCEKLDSLMQDAVGHNSGSQDIEIEIQGVNPVGFEQLLDFFYLGELDLQPHTVMPVWMTAAYLELPNVVSMCNEFCQQSVSCVSNQASDSPRKLHAVGGNAPGKTVARSATTDSTCKNGTSKPTFPGASRKGSLGQISSVKRSLSRSGVSSSLDEKTECEDILHEVEQLRMQHQQLRKLQQAQALLQNSVTDKKCLAQLQNVASTDGPSTKKMRTQPSSEDGSSVEGGVLSNPDSAAQDIDPTDMEILKNSTTSVDFRIVTDSFRASLYNKYPAIKQEPPVPATCPVEDLLQRGKTRKRKTSEQNTLNNAIRLVLDTMAIVESTDPRVEDALFLIMDRFDALRENVNDPSVRRSLLIKIKHSIHCKKWRTKRSMQNKKSEEADPDVIDMTLDG